MDWALCKTFTGGTSMSIVDELMELHKLLQAGGVTQSEYEAVKKRLINSSGESPAVKQNLLKQKGAPSTWQIAGIAVAGSLGGRLIADHLHNDHLQDQALDAVNANQEIDLSNVDIIEVRQISVNPDTDNIDITDTFFF
jgi:hypothetical protein